MENPQELYEKGIDLVYRASVKGSSKSKARRADSSVFKYKKPVSTFEFEFCTLINLFVISIN